MRLLPDVTLKPRFKTTKYSHPLTVGLNTPTQIVCEHSLSIHSNQTTKNVDNSKGVFSFCQNVFMRLKAEGYCFCIVSPFISCMFVHQFVYLMINCYFISSARLNTMERNTYVDSTKYAIYKLYTKYANFSLDMGIWKLQIFTGPNQILPKILITKSD